MIIRITWSETGDRDLRGIEKIAMGEKYREYVKDFSSLQEIISFWEEQLNRKIYSEIKILTVKFNDKND